MEVGKKIRYLREKKGIEQQQLSEIVGISQSKMNKIETGFQKRIEPEILRDIAKALNVKVGYLLGEENEDDSKTEKILNDPKTNIMFKDWEKMNDQQREEALTFIRFLISKDKNSD